MRYAIALLLVAATLLFWPRDPGGLSLYVLSAKPPQLSVYRMAGDRLRGLGRRIPLADADPRAIALDPAGRFAYLATPHDLALLASEGLALGSRFPASDGPVGMAVHPNGRYLYVAHARSRDAWSYRVDPATGALTHIANQPLPAAPTALAMDGAGAWVYVALQSGAVTVFGSDPADGQLKPTGRTIPVAAMSLLVDAAGRFLYVASARRIDTIRLDTLAVASTLPLDADPVALALDPTGTRAVAVGAKLSLFAVDPATGVWTRLQTIDAPPAPQAAAIR